MVVVDGEETGRSCNLNFGSGIVNRNSDVYGYGVPRAGSVGTVACASTANGGFSGCQIRPADQGEKVG